MGTLASQLILSLIDKVTGPSRGIAASLRRIDAQVDQLNRSHRAMMAPVANVAGRLIALGAGYVGVTQGMEVTVGAARKMQAALTEIGVKTGQTQAQLDRLRAQVLQLSPVTNQTTESLIAGVDTMVGLGLSAQEAAAAIPAIGKAATATGASMADLSAASVSAMQNLQVSAADLPRMLDAMASAGNAGAFELRDMAQYIPELGAAYQGLGQQGVGAVTDLAAALQIARKGTGDSASAATNLGNVLQKISSPATRKAFKKMGVNLEKEMAKAAKKGQTPIEAIAEITNRTLKGNLGRLGDLFEDSQVQQGLRPLIQNMEEYRRIRAEAAAATGTIADAFAKRMNNADEKIKAFQLRMQNLGASIGTSLLDPLGSAADYITQVFDTLGQRAGILDTISAATQGFMKGLGFDPNLKATIDSIRDFLFGKLDGSGAADQLGRIFVQAEGWGKSLAVLNKAVAESPLAGFFAEVGGYGLGLAGAAIGITLFAGAVRTLATAMYALTGARAAVGILATLARGGKWTASALGLLGTAAATPTLPPAGKTPPAAPLPSTPGKLPPVAAPATVPAAATTGGFGITLVTAGIAAGGAMASVFSMNALKSLDAGTRKMFADNPLLGGMAPDVAFAAGILDADENAAPARDPWGEAVNSFFASFSRYKDSLEGVTADQRRVARELNAMQGPNAEPQRRLTTDTAKGKRADDLEGRTVYHPYRGPIYTDTTDRFPGKTADDHVADVPTFWERFRRQNREMFGLSIDRPPQPPATPPSEQFTSLLGELSALTRQSAARLPQTPASAEGKPTLNLAAELSAITLRTQPAGVSEVRVTNPPPRPNVTVSAPITIHEATDAAAVAAMVRSQLNGAVSSALEGHFADGAQ